MGWAKVTVAAGLSGLVAGAATAQPARPQVTGPVATYWMSAETVSGFGAMAGGPGGRPNMGAIMGMMTGAGPGATQNLTLQLGSAQRPAGAPEAQHLPPAALRAGQSLPLLTPRAQPSQPVDETPELPREFERPRGRMLIFWGCGERAGAGQPVVIDFAQAAAGKIPPGLEALSRGLNVTPMRPPSPERHATYGEWPNERTRNRVPPGGSLVGEHVVRGNYTPEIRFTLGPNQDFLAPLQLTDNRVAPSGAAQIGWRAVPNARAYYATAIGGGQNETMVLWSSSRVQASAFALPDYISPADLNRLVGQGALMGPQTTACAIPREVVEAAPQAMLQLVAYGEEANFVHPPRPADPNARWDQQWTTKVRYKSSTGALLGMDMGAMGMSGMDEGEDQRPAPGRAQPPREQPPQPGDRARQILRGLGLPGT